MRWRSRDLGGYFRVDGPSVEVRRWVENEPGVAALGLNEVMEPIRYANGGLSGNPSGPLLREALVEIGQELDRQAAGDLSLNFKPLGAIEGYRPDDEGGALSRSMKLPESKGGLLRFDQPGSTGLVDLPRFGKGSKASTKLAKSTPVTVQISPKEVEVRGADGDEVASLPLADLLYARVDTDGWFFFVPRISNGDPLALRMNPWLVPGLALLIADAARKGTLQYLEADIRKKAGAL